MEVRSRIFFFFSLGQRREGKRKKGLRRASCQGRHLNKREARARPTTAHGKAATVFHYRQGHGVNVDFFFLFYSFVCLCRFQSTTASTQVPQVLQVPAMPAQRLIGCEIGQGRMPRVRPITGGGGTTSAELSVSTKDWGQGGYSKRTCRGRGVSRDGGVGFFFVQAARRGRDRWPLRRNGRLYESGIWISYTKLALTASRG